MPSCSPVGGLARTPGQGSIGEVKRGACPATLRGTPDVKTRGNGPGREDRGRRPRATGRVPSPELGNQRQTSIVERNPSPPGHEDVARAADNDASLGLAVGAEDMADCPDHVTEGRIVEGSERPGVEVEVGLADREDRLGLNDAILAQSERSG